MARRLGALKLRQIGKNLVLGRNGLPLLLTATGAWSAGGQLTQRQATLLTSQAVFAVAERVEVSHDGDDVSEHRWQQLRPVVREALHLNEPTWSAAPQLDFDDARSAFAKHGSLTMLRSMGVFSLCSVKPLVSNADAILASLKGVCGDSIINAAVKRTLFSHFCAGESTEEVQPLAQRLRANGIGSILAYSVESDVDAGQAFNDHAAEAQCDQRLHKLMESVLAAQTDDGCGFAAVKVTALGQPHMLEAVSAALTAGRPPCELPDRQLALMDATVARLTRLAGAASKAGVRLLIDAEQSCFQPAIDLFALELQRHFNAQQPVVGNTYQCYREDTHQRLLADMARANAEGWYFGAKLVRGAYMVLERQRAAQLGHESPVHVSKAATDANYDRCVAEVLQSIAAGSGAEVIVAGHNQRSIQAAVEAMQRLGLPPQQSGVHFAQLMGMCDYGTYTLANSGYQAVKYLPYGPIAETMPYLIRRAQENSDIMGGVGHEVRLLRSELWRRCTTRLPSRQSASAGSSADPQASRDGALRGGTLWSTIKGGMECHSI